MVVSVLRGKEQSSEGILNKQRAGSRTACLGVVPDWKCMYFTCRVHVILHVRYMHLPLAKTAVNEPFGH